MKNFKWMLVALIPTLALSFNYQILALSHDSSNSPVGALDEQARNETNTKAAIRLVTDILEHDEFLPVAFYNLLINCESIQKECNVSKKEVTCLRELAVADKNRINTGNPNTIYRSSMIKAIRTIQADSKRRVFEICLQIYTLEALCGKGIQTTLALTIRQSKLLSDVIDDYTRQSHKLILKSHIGTLDTIQIQRSKLKKSSIQKCFTILTELQRKQFRTLMGHSFSLEIADALMSPALGPGGMSAFVKRII
jgi:hypothetical protein